MALPSFFDFVTSHNVEDELHPGDKKISPPDTALSYLRIEFNQMTGSRMSAPSSLLDESRRYGLFIEVESGLKDGLRIIGKAAFQIKKEIEFKTHSKSG